jgi:hypothetical protein
MSHFLAAEQLIMERLGAELPSDIKLQELPDVESAGSVSGRQSTVLVIYDSYAVGTGPLLEVDQRWLTVIVTNDTAGVRTGQAARQLAGELATSVIQALHNWRPNGYMAMKLTTAPAAAAYEGGRYFLPLAWTTKKKDAIA